MQDKKIKAVLFDYGETLINFGKIDTAKVYGRGARLAYDFLQSNGPAKTPGRSCFIGCSCFFWIFATRSDGQNRH